VAAHHYGVEAFARHASSNGIEFYLALKGINSARSAKSVPSAVCTTDCGGRSVRQR
jgi:hypothetical protein